MPTSKLNLTKKHVLLLMPVSEFAGMYILPLL